ncbi:hypothetical protein I2492_03195 [Budviciaceae bacterium CWB-B4]|uniref:Tape measure protein N-terminal domain-containing protein n=1 Tax=Limnobaculum xujianqingii TaxID=2738837 RepID=A0A9D7AG06_9GAMM|nr:tape measure protein [Limnobaculum xujianqingii]MBK5072024.1 hypothetical protein [Limnobaculum xujianqingii]MBK5175333.1 hypothetical protein [Limnobaculum xujianqingii]
MITANMSLSNEMNKIRELNKLLESGASIYVNYLKIQKSILGDIQEKIREISKDSVDGAKHTGNQLIKLFSLIKQGAKDLKNDLHKLSIAPMMIFAAIGGGILLGLTPVLRAIPHLFRAMGRTITLIVRMSGAGIILAFKLIGKGIIGVVKLAGKGILKSFKWIGSNIANMVKTFASGFQKIPGLLAKIPVKSFAEQAQEMQTLQKRIRGLPQQFCDSADGLAYLSRQANRARRPIASYGEAYISLAKSTKSFITSPLEISNALNTMSNALTLGTGNSEEQEEALTALTKGFKKGALDSSELSGFLKLLSEKDLKQLELALDMSCGSLLTMAEQGEVTGAQLIDGLKKVGPAWQDQVNGMPLTIGQATDKISNRWQTFLFNLENKTGVINKITNFIFQAFKFIEKQLDRFISKSGGASAILAKFVNLCIKGFGYINKIISWFVKYCGGAKQALVTLGIVLGGLGIASFIAALTPILIPLGLIVAALLLVGKVVKDVFAWLNGEQSVLGDFFGPWAEFAPKLTAAWHTFSTKMIAVWSTVKNIISTVWNECSRMFELMAPSFSVLWDGITSIFSGGIDVLAGLWDIIMGIFTVDSERINSGFASIFTGITNIFNGLIKSVIGYLSAMGAAIGDVFNNMLASLWSVIKGWVAKIPGATAFLGDSFDQYVPSGKAPAYQSLTGLEGLSNMGNSIGNITAMSIAPNPNIINSQRTANNQINVAVPAGTNEQQAQSIAAAVKASLMDVETRLAKNLAGGVP